MCMLGLAKFAEGSRGCQSKREHFGLHPVEQAVLGQDRVYATPLRDL